MVIESQKAFAEWYGDNPTELSPLANRTTQQTLDAWVWQSWQAAEAYGRKQALEEAIALFDNQEWDTRYLADTVAQELKGLIK